MSPRSSEANRLMRQRARDRILAGSFQVFREKGFHGASMSEIARAAGVSKGLAYNYFSSKEELVAAVLEVRLDHLLEVVGSLEEQPTPRAQLAAFIDGILGQVTRDPDPFRLFLALSLEDRARPALRGALRDLQDRVDRYLGEVRSLFIALGAPDPELETLIFRSTLLGLCVRIVQAREPLPLEEIRARLLEIHAGPAAPGRGEGGR